MSQTTVNINETEIKEAAQQGWYAFIHVFTTRYRELIGQTPSTDTMTLLNGEQHTLLAYDTYRQEMLEGGTCQLIQNGYGPYIFDNPFAKVMRLWGLGDFSKMIYKAKKIYDEHRGDLEKERSEDEFMAMYEQYEDFDDIDDWYVEEEDTITAMIATYIDEHIELFAKIVKD